jgi:hypothetical protein
VDPCLFVAAVIIDSSIVISACKPHCDWVAVGQIVVDALRPDSYGAPTVAVALGALVVGHAFWQDYNHKVGWWGAPLDAVRRAVGEDGAPPPHWKEMTRAIGTPVREHAACVAIPAY